MAYGGKVIIFSEKEDRFKLKFNTLTDTTFVQCAVVGYLKDI